MPLRSFKSFVKERLGLHFGSDADGRLASILAGRLTRTATGSIDDYLKAVAADPVELVRLTSLLTVNETYFYREPDHLNLLVDRLVPARLAQAEKGNPIRILSLGCSTGEEPYSIAIALRERYGDLSERLFRLIALDGVFLFEKTPVEPSPGRVKPRQGVGADTTGQTRPSASLPRAEAAGSVSIGRGAPGAIDPRPDPPEPIVPIVTPVDPQRYEQALTSARSERFEEALRHLAPLCDREDAAAEHLALQAHLLLERGDTAGAEAAAQRALTQDPWSSDALLLLGRCARLRGDTREAISALRRVIYDTPSCWRAHYQLAETYRQHGETGPAEREYRIVLRQLQNETLAMQNTGARPSLLSVKDLRFLCETRLARLADAAA